MNKQCIDFYEKYYGKSMPYCGLCSHFECTPANDRLLLMTPTGEDAEKLNEEGFHNGFWGAGIKKDYFDIRYKFTQLRETIVLFMACLSEEELINEE